MRLIYGMKIEDFFGGKFSVTQNGPNLGLLTINVIVGLVFAANIK